MFTVHFFLEISITFVLKLYSLNVIKKIENQIESLQIEIESGHLNRYPALVYTMVQQYLPHILQDQMLVSGAQDL